MWKDIGEACEWEHPRIPSVRPLWDGRATEAVLEFLRTTRVGCIGAERIPPEDRGGSAMERREGQGPPRIYISFVLPFFFFLYGARLSSGWVVSLVFPYR